MLDPRIVSPPGVASCRDDVTVHVSSGPYRGPGAGSLRSRGVCPLLPVPVAARQEVRAAASTLRVPRRAQRLVHPAGQRPVRRPRQRHGHGAGLRRVAQQRRVRTLARMLQRRRRLLRRAGARASF